jgi:hypothetical protein
MIEEPGAMCGTAAFVRWKNALEVGGDRAVPFLVGGVDDGVARHLERGVADEHVHAAERVDGLRDDVAAVGGVGEVAAHDDRLPAGLLDETAGVLGVRVLLLGEVVDEDVGALARVGQRDRLPDAAVGAGDDGGLALQAAGSAVALLAVVGLGREVALGAGDLLLLLGLGHGSPSMSCRVVRSVVPLHPTPRSAGLPRG